jgi:hypothetical protein
MEPTRPAIHFNTVGGTAGTPKKASHTVATTITNIITIALLTSTLRMAWAVIHRGQRAYEWVLIAERRPDAMERLCKRVVAAGEILEVMV